MNPALFFIFILHFSRYAWPLGQEVKTPPFHGGIMGSIPVGVTTKVFSINLYT